MRGGGRPVEVGSLRLRSGGATEAVRVGGSGAAAGGAALAGAGACAWAFALG